MSSPVLHVLAGPNDAGKSTFGRAVLQPVTHLPFINADEIAAAIEREQAFAGRHSFITETVFSHPSKLELVRHVAATGYLVALHVILVPEDVTVLRVAHRVTRGGHTVPEAKIRERYRRLWGLVAEARSLAHSTTVYDNSRAASPFEVVARYERGRLIGSAAWPSWTPSALTS